MRIGCLQFAPHVGDIDNNLDRADAILNRADPDSLDLLVLPELAFSGYNFKSLHDIFPYLEASGSGISSLWARTVALKYDATVIVGYPEKVDIAERWPADPEYYNSAIVVNGEGEPVANYRKTHLFMTDERWALEGGGGFFGGWLDGLGQTAIGICMDLNPYRFEAPWSAYEFAFHVLEVDANMVVLSMAWLTREDARIFSRMPQEPDMDTLMYWVSRLEPVIRTDNDEEIIVVFANRAGVEGDAVYAGTSAVLGIKDGEVRVYGILGRGDKELLVVDTDKPPFARLVYRPEDNQLTSVPGPSPRTGQRADTSTAGHSRPKEGSGSMPTDHRTGNNGSREPQADISDYSTPTISDRSTTTSRASSHSRRPDNRSRHISNNDNSTKKARKEPANKLSLTTDNKTLNQRRNHSPPLRTPTCPSPTPMFARPRLTVPPADSLMARFLDDQDSTPHARTVRKANRNTSNVVQPHAANPYLLEPTSAQDDPQIWGGSVKFTEDGKTPSTASSTARTHFSDASPSYAQLYWVPSTRLREAPLEIRGRTPAAESDMTTFSETESSVSLAGTNCIAAPRSKEQMKARVQTTRAKTPSDDLCKQETKTRSKPQQDANTNSSKKGDTISYRPSWPKSRNGSRSRGPERSGPAMDTSTNLNSIAHKLDEIAKRVDISHGHSTPDNTIQDLHQAPNTERTSSIPARRQRSSSSNWRSRLPDRPSSRSTRPHQGVQNGQDRTASRGRQGFSRHSSPGQPGEVRRSSKQRQTEGSTVEAVDLSQFRLIEDYPSPNCPLHGRTPSQSRGAPRATSRSKASRNHGGSNKSFVSRFQDSPRSSPVRAHTSDPLSRQEEPILQLGAPPVVRSRTTINTDHRVATKPTPSSKIPVEPTTPRAMILVSDSAFSGPVFDPSLKCVERTVVAEVGLHRTQSAIW